MKSIIPKTSKGVRTNLTYSIIGIGLAMTLLVGTTMGIVDSQRVFASTDNTVPGFILGSQHQSQQLKADANGNPESVSPATSNVGNSKLLNLKVTPEHKVISMKKKQSITVNASNPVTNKPVVGLPVNLLVKEPAMEGKGSMEGHYMGTYMYTNTLKTNGTGIAVFIVPPDHHMKKMKEGTFTVTAVPQVSGYILKNPDSVNTNYNQTKMKSKS